MLVYLDAVQQFATGVGTGGLTLGAATSGIYRTMQAAGMVNGDTARVRIDNADVPTEWEVVLVEYNSGGISRTFDSRSFSSTGSLINFSAGNKVISGVSLAGDIEEALSTAAEALAIAAAGNEGGLIYDTKAELDADLAHDANKTAQVIADGANNGLYKKIGASGTGSWTKISDATIPSLEVRMDEVESDVAALYAADVTINAAIAAEEAARIADVNAEEAARIADVNAEEAARIADVNAEEAARIAADTALSERADVTEEIIHAELNDGIYAFALTDIDGNLVVWGNTSGRVFAAAGMEFRIDDDDTAILETVDHGAMISRDAEGVVRVNDTLTPTTVIRDDEIGYAITDEDGNIILGISTSEGIIGTGGSSSGESVSSPSGMRLAVNGDSLGAQQVDEDTRFKGFNARGWAAWLVAFSRHGLVFEMEDNYADGGSVSEAILSFALDIVAHDPPYDIVAQQGGSINDVKSSLPITTTFANWKAAADLYIANGMKFLWCPILPRAAGSWTDGSSLTEAEVRRKLAAVNHLMINYARVTPGIILFDPRDQLVDPATGDLSSWATYDGTHLTPRAAYWVGRRGFEALQQYYNVKTSTYNWFDANDVYHATENPQGNLLQNGVLRGTAGTLNAAHLGVVPTDWTSGYTTGVDPGGAPTAGTLTFSRPARSDGAPGEQFQMTMAGLVGTGIRAQHYVEQDILLSGGKYVAGSVIEGSAELEVLAGSHGVQAVSFEVLEDNGVDVINYHDMGRHEQFYYTTDQAYSILLKLPKFTVRATSGGTPKLTVRMSIYADLTVTSPTGASITAKWSRINLNKAV